MDRESVNCFVTLSEIMNFSEAAEQLYMSQPTLSRKIRALEKELGRELFKRDTRNIQLTGFGRQFLPFARQILTSFRSADLFINNYREEVESSITLGTVTCPECFEIDKILIDFSEKYPDISINLIENPALILEKQFAEGRFNLYCTCDRTISHGALFIPTGTSSLTVLLPEGDALAQKEEIGPPDLDGRNLLLPYETDPFLDSINNEFEESGVLPKVVYKGAAVSSISLVQSGIGVSILPVEVAEKYMADNICCRPFAPETTFVFGLGYRSPEMLSESEKTLVRFVRDNCRQ